MKNIPSGAGGTVAKADADRLADDRRNRVRDNNYGPAGDQRQHRSHHELDDPDLHYAHRRARRGAHPV